MPPRLERCLKGHLVCSHSLLVFSKQSTIRKNRLSPAKDEVSTPAGAPPDPGHGFYSHISCCPGESLFMLSCPLQVRIPIAGLAVRPSGLDPGPHGYGVELVEPGRVMPPDGILRRQYSIPSTLVSPSSVVIFERSH